MPARIKLLTLLTIAAIVGAGFVYFKKQQTVALANAQEFAAAQPATTPDDAELLDAEIQLPLKAYKTVEQALGAPFPHAPQAFRTKPDAITEAAQYNWFTQLSIDQFQKIHRALELLGFLPPEQDFISQLVSADAAADSIGIYDHYARELLLAEHFDPENPAHDKQLIRLLSIAHLQLTHPIEERLDWDSALSRKALIDSRAQQIAGTPPPTHPATAPLSERYLTFFTSISPDADTQALLDAPSSRKLLDLPSSNIRAQRLNQAPEDGQPLLETPLGSITTKHYLETIGASEIMLQLLDEWLTIRQGLPTSPQAIAPYFTTWKTLWKNPESAQTFATAANTFYQSSPHDVAVTRPLPGGRQVIITVRSAE